MQSHYTTQSCLLLLRAESCHLMYHTCECVAQTREKKTRMGCERLHNCDTTPIHVNTGIERAGKNNLQGRLVLLVSRKKHFHILTSFWVLCIPILVQINQKCWNTSEFYWILMISDHFLSKKADQFWTAFRSAAHLRLLKCTAVIFFKYCLTCNTWGASCHPHPISQVFCIF